MRTIRLLPVACALGVSMVSAQSPSPMREGLWEVTMQMQMPGMSMPAMKSTQCVTKEQLKSPEKALPSASPGCSMSDYKADGAKVTWKMACKDMAGTGEMMVKGDSYEGRMNVTSPHAMVMTIAGKRVGNCTQ